MSDDTWAVDRILMLDCPMLDDRNETSSVRQFLDLGL